MKPATRTSILQATRPLKQHLREIIQHLRAEVGNVDEPKAQALLETSAEVLVGLLKAFQDYEKGTERAWRPAATPKPPAKTSITAKR